MGKEHILAAVMATAALMGWLLSVQRGIHDALSDDSEWKSEAKQEMIELHGRVDELERIVCTYPQYVGHADCPR